MPSQSYHHPQVVFLAQFSLYVHNGGLKPDSFHFLPHELLYWGIFFIKSVFIFALALPNWNLPLSSVPTISCEFLT